MILCNELHWKIHARSSTYGCQPVPTVISQVPTLARLDHVSKGAISFSFVFGLQAPSSACFSCIAGSLNDHLIRLASQTTSSYSSNSYDWLSYDLSVPVP
jgi:hypothetical protein